MKTPDIKSILWLLLLLGGLAFEPKASAQWKYDVTLTDYPQARWKALTSYIDKPALADLTGDGIPEIVAASVWGDIFCVDGATGQILWAYEDEHSFELAIYVCPALVDVNCDNIPDVVSVTPQGNVICLDGRNGRKLWSFKADAPTIFSPSAFDLDRNGTAEIVFSDTSGNLYLIGNAGKLVWKVHNEVQFYGSPAIGVIDGRPVVITADHGGTLRSFDAIGGKPLWVLAPAKSPISTSPIVFKDSGDAAVSWKVLAGTVEGNVYLADAKLGRLLWNRPLASKEIVGDFALGDVSGDGKLDAVFSTSGSRILAVSLADGRELWSSKHKVPVKEYLAVRERKRLLRDVLTGEPVLADLDGDGKLDVVVAARGLNNYIFGLRGSNGHELWAYGNKNLMVNPALNKSTNIGCCMDVPQGSYSTTVPAYSEPTPVLADFDGDGKADLIINDRDEVGLISVPIPAAVAPGTWAKYIANLCNNNVNFSIPCLGTAPSPNLSLVLEPSEIFRGESARLCWKSRDSDLIEIDQGIGRVGAEDCIVVKPISNTTWRGIASGCGGEAKAEVTLLVKLPPPPPPPPPIIREPWSLEDVFFEYDWYRLTPEARKTLDQNVDKLKAHPEASVALEATCDERGSFIYNKYLAIARAESVREYLVNRGIDATRMELRPQGETTKWDARLTDEGWALNRRVHFVILK